MILLIKCPAMDAERERWRLDPFSEEKETRQHLTVGFAHLESAFGQFLVVR